MFVTLIVGVTAWGGFDTSRAYATADSRPDGRYIKVEIDDLPYDKVCLAYASYGDLVLPHDGECVECALSEAGRRLIRIDEHNELRLVILNDRVDDVYPITATDAFGS